MIKQRLLDKENIVFYLWLGLAYLVLNLLGNLSNNDASFIKLALNSFWLIAYLLVVNYFVFEYVIPTSKLSWKSIVKIPLVFVFCLFLYSFGLYAWRCFGVYLGIFTPIKIFEFICDGIISFFPNGLSSLLFFGIIRHVYNYRKLKESAHLLRIEKQEAELNFLKAQTNPHFLFNTLNNIYSLARDKNDLAEEAILRLSALLRFMLYETNVSYIAIGQELKVIKDYIELERLRYDDTLNVNLHHDIDSIDQSIPPLLLIPLVENAFKHGVSEGNEKQYIGIQLSIKDKQLNFEVKNTHESLQIDKIVNENIGLSNLKRQLALLYFEYKLSYKYEENNFIASLFINLNSDLSRDTMNKADS